MAVAFVTAWAAAEGGEARWLQQTGALATPEFAAKLRTVDPAHVPAHRVTGAAVLRSGDSVSATVAAPTDAGVVLVDVVAMGSAWKVNGITPTGPAGRTTGAASSLAATYTPSPAGG